VRMSLIYWERELEQPTVPFDVHFLLEVEDGAGAAAGGRVSAHKLVLALSSPVFKVQLFGGWSSDDVPILVTDVTFRAFRALVDYIYGKPLDRVFFDVLGLEAAARLLELAYAAEKYQVKNLTEELVAVIGKCSLTRDKQEVASMAELAAENTHLEAVSCSLLARCGIVSEGDFDVRESRKSEGGGSTSENLAIEEQPNHNVELAIEEQPHHHVELAGEDEAGIEFLQVVMDFV